MFKCFNQTLQELNIIILIQNNQSLMEESPLSSTITMSDLSIEIANNSIETAVESNLTFKPAAQQDNPIGPAIQFSIIQPQNQLQNQGQNSLQVINIGSSQQELAFQKMQEQHIVQAKRLISLLFPGQSESVRTDINQLKQILNHLHINNLSTQQTIDYLESKGFIKRVPLNSLILLALQNKENLFIDNFQKFYRKFCVHEAGKNYMVPIITGFSQDFIQYITSWYFHEFSEQMKEKQLPSKHKLQKPENFYEKGEGQFKLEPTKDKEAELPKKQQEGLLTAILNGFDLNAEKVQAYKQAQIPAAFYTKQVDKDRISAKRLLTLDLTVLFNDQLNQVKKVLTEQLGKENSYVLENYFVFLRRYEEFYMVKTGKMEVLQQMDYLLNKLQDYEIGYLSQSYNKVHYDHLRKSQMLNAWDSIFQNLQAYVASQPPKKITKESIKLNIQQIIKNVTICYTPGHDSQTTSAITNSKGIFININHIRNQLSVSQFTEGPLRPYILLCLYHQLAHALIRKMVHPEQKIKPEVDKDRSFELNEHSFGCSMLKMIRNLSPQIKFSLNQVICSDNYEVKRLNYQKIDGKIKTIYDSNKHFKVLVQKLKAQYGNIKELKQLIGTISFIKTETIQVPNEKWIGLCQSIVQRSKLDKHSNANQKQFDEIKRNEYYLIKDLLLIEQWFDVLNIKNEGRYKEAIKIIYEQQKKYFDSQNSFIEEIIQLIKERNPKLLQKSRQIGMLNSFKVNSKLSQFIQDKIKHLGGVFGDNVDQVSGFNSKLLHILRISQNIQIQTIDNYFSENVLQDSNSWASLQVIKAQILYRQVMRYIKLSQISKICSQLPDFISYQLKNGVFDSGHYFEDMIFPKFHGFRHIYAKDYDILKNLSKKNASNIGIIPTNSKQANLSVLIRRGISGQGQGDWGNSAIEMDGTSCGVQRHGYYHYSSTTIQLSDIKYNSQKEFNLLKFAFGLVFNVKLQPKKEVEKDI